MEHLFNVSAGLDSQILGDYEIIGQLKKAVNIARKMGFIQAFTDRLVNTVLQASKNIKNNTGLSGGTVSVSFAAIQYIREHIKEIDRRRIVLLGTGKIGSATCLNLVDYLGASHITLLNRTPEKAAVLAGKLGLQYAPMEDMEAQVAAADIILVATDAAQPILHTHHLTGYGNKLVIDLSIPYNVAPEVRHLPNITLVNVDELSKLKDETLQKREAEVPHARAIIARHIEAFHEWKDMRKNASALKAARNKLQDMQHCQLFINYSTQYNMNSFRNSDEKIQKVINGMATKLRRQYQPGCNFIEAINDYIATGNN
jgi:glutamyl-tRNA reductase